MVVVRIVTSGADGKLTTPAFGLAGSIKLLAPYLLAPVEEVAAPAFYTVFVRELRPAAEFWDDLRRAIAGGLYDPKTTPLLLDGSWESYDFDPEAFEFIHAQLTKLGIPLGSVAYLQMCVHTPRFYQEWADRQRLRERMRIYAHGGTNMAVARHVSATFGDDAGFQEAFDRTADARLNGELPRWRFLCFNNIQKPWRTTTALLLAEKAADLSRVSFGRYRGGDFSEDAKHLKTWALDNSNLKARLKTFAGATPMVLDVETGTEAARSYTSYQFDPAIYFDTAMSVVTESDMSSAGHLRLTEKSFKPLAMFHPMLMCGNQGALGALRDMGFRTFAPLIDESYDALEKGPERLEAVHRQIVKLAEMPAAAFAEGLRSVWPAIAHNAWHFRQMLDNVHAIEVQGICRSLRRDFAARFGFPAVARIAVPAGAETAWPAAPQAQVSGVVDLFVSDDRRKLRLSAGAALNQAHDVFVHYHTPAGVRALGGQWPQGRNTMIVNLPAETISQLDIGQFTTRNGPEGVVYDNVWRASIELS